MRISIVGFSAGLGCLILCAIFLYANPYSSSDLNKGTITIFYAMLILPALVGMGASLWNNRKFMYIVFVWSLPCGLYVTFAAVPSVWNLFGVVLVMYGLSAKRMKRSNDT